MEFEISDVILLFANNSQVRDFIEKCQDSGKKYYLEARGITTMESVIC